MKSTLLISGRMFGGGQRVVQDLLVGLSDISDVEPRLVLLGGTGDAFRQWNPTVIPYDGCYNSIKTLRGTSSQLASHLKNDPCDVLHTHGWDADVIGGLALHRSSGKQLAHLHVTAEWIASKSLKHRIRRALTRWILNRPGIRTIAVSYAVSDHWSKHLRGLHNPIHVVHNGIDADHFSPGGHNLAEATSPDSTIRLGVAARLAPMKGLEHLIDAAAILRDRNLPFTIQIAGEGGLRDKLQQRIDSLNLGEKVRLVGFLSDTPKFYRGLDVFVLPSVSTEGLPLTILEAMASEVPVVATTVGGAPEVIRSGENGVLVSPGNTEALADAIADMIHDGHRRRTMGVNARKTVLEAFTLAHCSRQVFRHYQLMMTDSVVTD